MSLSVLNLVLRRSLGHWRLLAVVAAGVIVAAALTASTAIYSDAVRDLGLTFALRQVPKLKLDLTVDSSSQFARPRDDGLRRQTVQNTVKTYAGRWLSGDVEYGKSATFFLTGSGEPVPADDQRPRSFFQYVQDLPVHVRIDEGDLKLHTDVAADPSQAPTVNVVVGKETADAFNIHVGDHFDLHPFWHLEVRPVVVQVAGIIEPKDLSEEYWFGKTDRFAFTSTTWRTYPFFIDQQTMSQVLAAYLPDLSSDISTFFFFKAGSVNANNATNADVGFRAAINQVERQVERTTADSKLPETIASYQQKLFFTRLPLFALIMQVVGIVLYYIVMVSTMLVDRQAAEIALFKSRGASTGQVMLIYAIEGGIIAMLGAIFGPPLASLVVKLLGPTPPFHQLSGGNLLATHVSVQAIWLAIGGSALSLAALLWPALRASGFSLVQYRRNSSRPQEESAFTRYYLDVFLIVAGGVLFYELRQRGSLVTKQLFGDLKADPLLLVTPALFTLMIALLFLRLFPVVLRLIVRLLAQISSTSVLLGLWHMVRSPVHYSRLILLLILATSLGMFAAGFRSTLDKSYNDRAKYQAGSALRVEGVRDPTGITPAELGSRVRSATGAMATSSALRITGSYTPKRFTSVDPTVLAIDPATFSSAAYWRDDFSPHSLNSIQKSLAKDAPKDPAGTLLPDGTRWLGVWVKTPSPNQNYTLAARLIDSNGRVLDYDMNGPRGPQPALGDWTFFSANVLQPGFGGSFRPRPGPAPVQPLRFVSLYVRSRNSQRPETITDYFDDLQVSTDAANQPGPAGFANGIPVLDFEQIDLLEPIDGLTSKPTTDTFSRSAKEAHTGAASGQLTWSRDMVGLATHGFRVRGDGQSLDVYASDSFIKAAGVHPGQTVSMYLRGVYVPVRILGTFGYFPSYVPDPNRSLLVADLDRVLYEVNRTPGTVDALYANDVWAAGNLDASAGATVKKSGVVADNYVSLAGILATQQRDPLVAASWEGILFLAFSAALLLTALGFVVYSYLTASARSLEFAVLRTMGLSTLQIIGVVSFEQLFVVAAGVLTGTILGLPLSRLMIGYMGITETGATVVPPFVSSVSWQAVVTSYLGIAVVLISAVFSLVVLYSRLSVSRVLRIGEA